MKSTCRFVAFSAALVAVCSMVLAGCSSVRLKYDAQIKTEDGKTGRFEYVSSHSTGSIPVFCGLTAIFLGGACWFYTVMPTVTQKGECIDLAEAELAEAFKGKKYEIVRSTIEQVSWSGGEPQKSLELK